MSEVKNILLCGVGGQGTILASKLLSHALVEAGYDVKMSEIHGMSQRGGSVVTQVRYGTEVFSPIIGKGCADILVAFESMEALRYAENLRPDGVVVVNDYEIPTATTLSGAQDYPHDSVARVSAVAKTHVLDAFAVAKEVGAARSMNVVLLGALVKLMGLENLDWDGALKACMKPNLVEINKIALDAGMKAVS